MENQAIIVVPRAEAMELEISVTTQSLRETQFAVAKALGIPSNRITCHIKRLGTKLRLTLLYERRIYHFTFLLVIIKFLNFEVL